MPVKVYKLDLSPPARAVIMACDIYKVPVEFIDVDLMNKEHLKPAYLKMNPLHTVPVLVDDDVILHDSHAILIYLSEVYGNNGTLYPNNVKQRALINQKLFFNNSYLFTRLGNVTYPIFMSGARGVDQKKLDDINVAYGILEEFLTRTTFLAGDNLTIADIAAFTTVCGLMYILPIDNSRYPKINSWIKKLENQPYAKKCNEQPAKMYGQFIQKAIQQ
ncbi:unnamed protein product [Diatraea saccharalis]|uniref:Uncharacterized protein n=1 Tax=Diatraea saccharalis TaxID=40085 RepID=A0A9N9QX69_9NEOP|nr:unnamed protein product [Diatraea saccharalis]